MNPDIAVKKKKDLLRWAVEKLRHEGIQTPQLDAEVLLSHALTKDRLHLYLDLEETIDKGVDSYYRTLIGKRLARVPVAYLTGYKEFMSLDFKVNENVLIPRPETEILVETVCKLGKPESRVLELGTGSGAIAISLAKYNPSWYIIATDLSMGSLLIARENARLHGVERRIFFLQGDLFNALSPQGRFDWVVSNPPYIPTKDLHSLPDEVRKYEPILALNGGADGLEVIRRIIEEAHTVLKPDGRLAIEIGYGQGEGVQKIANETGKYSGYSMIKDYSGIPRVFYLTLSGST